jgi:2-iminoacetate synthase
VKNGTVLAWVIFRATAVRVAGIPPATTYRRCARAGAAGLAASVSQTGDKVTMTPSAVTEPSATGAFINDEQIEQTLRSNRASDAVKVRDVLSKARTLQGLEADEIAALMAVTDRDLLEEVFHAARQVKERIYGSRLVLFAPLYISNLCSNECLYCAFRARNREVKRRALSQDEIRSEVRTLVSQGHKRVLVVAGESYPQEEGFSYVLKAIESVYSVRLDRGEIRRVNVNVAPLTVEQFKQLKATNIGTYQLFQETYHRDSYARMHVAGKKRDYDWRVTAMDRAMQAGIDDVGIGPLFGLADWRFEVLAMMQHIRHLEARFGVGPHTISVPRIEPAVGSCLATVPPYAVSDADFLKIVAILRLAVPYTGIIMSTRESPEMRRQTFALGVSQISGGSRTSPGGYGQAEKINESQFCMGDHRSLDQVIRDIAKLGYMPSFCTACYRLGRTGRDFMDMAKPGEIKDHCEPNAMSTFLEYLLDYASCETLAVGEARIADRLGKMDGRQRQIAEQMLEKVRAGRRDVLV